MRKLGLHVLNIAVIISHDNNIKKRCWGPNPLILGNTGVVLSEMGNPAYPFVVGPIAVATGQYPS